MPKPSPISPDHPNAGALWCGAIAKGVLPIQTGLTGTLTKAMRQRRTALDQVLASVEPFNPAGVRIPLLKGSRLDQELVKAALAIDPRTAYPARGFPSDDELAPLCRYRFRFMDAYHREELTPAVADMDAQAKRAFATCRLPTIDDIISAIEMLHACDGLRARNTQVPKAAWWRDLVGLREKCAGAELEPSAIFEERFGPMIAELGLLETVFRLLEYAFEFERTCEYVTEHLAQLRAMTGPIDAKAKVYGAFDPNLVNYALVNQQAITSEDWEGQACLNAKALKGIRLDRHQANPPEGERWHLLLGRSPLEFILFFLFQAQDRFAAMTTGVQANARITSSALLRIAINFLAHIDADEAQAELRARVSHSNRSAGDGDVQRALSRSDFNVFFMEQAGEHADLINEPTWGGAWVAETRKIYDRLVAKGLHDEERNPYARAFPMCEAWSRERTIRSLDASWRRAGRPLERLDAHYAPPGRRRGHPIGKRETLAALELAAMLVEAPNPVSMARSLGLPRSALMETPPAGDVW